MFGRKSTAETAAITWTDTETGKAKTTEVTVANGATFDSHAAGVIAGAELNGLRDTHRVQITNVRRKD